MYVGAMNPQLVHYGESQSPVVTIDDFCGTPERIVEIAAALAPFPSASGTYYPGLRRTITTDDELAYRYVNEMMQVCAQFIGGAFDVSRFDLIEASFSMVTASPQGLAPAQRAPHFDSTDPNYFAILHYLSDTPGTGTAFYRQRSTGIELVTDDNIQEFIGTGQRQAEGMAGYTNDSNEHFEQIGKMAGIVDRLIIYQGSLLHSGIIPTDMNFSADPKQGRLTANIFINGHQDQT